MDLPFLRRNIPKTKKRSNTARRADEPRHAAQEDTLLVRHQQHPPLPDPSCEQQPARIPRPGGAALPFLPRSTRPRIRRQAVAAAMALEPPDPAIHNRHSKMPAPGSAAVPRWWCSHVERRAITTAGGSEGDHPHDIDGPSPPPPKIMTTTRHPLTEEEEDDQQCSGYPCPICHGRFRPYAASSSVRMVSGFFGGGGGTERERENPASQSVIHPLLATSCLFVM